MNQAITIELQFFLVSIMSGAILLAVYDVLRILRRLIIHDSLLIALEDMLFWVGASLFIFAMMFKENDGIIRGFSIMGMAIGMVLYHFVLSDLLVNLITKFIRMLFSPFVFAYKKVKGFFSLLLKQGKRIVNFITRRLKKRTKSVRMALDKRNQAAKLRRQKRSGERRLKKQIASEEKEARKQAHRKASGGIEGKKTQKIAARRIEGNKKTQRKAAGGIEAHKKTQRIATSRLEDKREEAYVNNRAARPTATLERINSDTWKQAEHLKKAGK